MSTCFSRLSVLLEKCIVMYFHSHLVSMLGLDLGLPIYSIILTFPRWFCYDLSSCLLFDLPLYCTHHLYIWFMPARRLPCWVRASHLACQLSPP